MNSGWLLWGNYSHWAENCLMNHKQWKDWQHWYVQHREEETSLTRSLATECRNILLSRWFYSLCKRLETNLFFQQAPHKEERGIFLMAEEKNRGGCEYWGSENIKHQNMVPKYVPLAAVGGFLKLDFLLGWPQTFYAAKADVEFQVLMVYAPHVGITGKHSDTQHPMTPLALFTCLFIYLTVWLFKTVLCGTYRDWTPLPVLCWN